MQRIAGVHEIPAGGGKAFEVAGRRIAVFNVDGTFYAIDDECSHAKASLSEGWVDADACQVACPRHGARFNLKTGAAESLPATRPVAAYAVEVRGDDVWIALE